MRLWIAEKYELAEVIAKNLGSSRKAVGHFLCGDDRVAWCAGHMLELCEPADYDEKYGKWNKDHLPIVMVPWKYKPIPNRRKQLGVIRDLIKEAEEIVHAGDADEEGQLLVDEILEYYKVKKPVRRVLINDYNDKLVQKAINNLQDNRKFLGLSQRALARSVGDLHWGVNMSRLYTLSANKAPKGQPLSVGRVQTPILGLVVNRDRAVESHKEAFHYTLEGAFTVDDGTSMTGILRFPETIARDEKGRLLSSEPLVPIEKECGGKTATVVSVAKETVHTPAPLPYDLLELQADASRKFKYSPSKTLKVTQALREKHKLITYNRSDCRYLSDEKHQEAPDVLQAIKDNSNILANAVQNADAKIKSRAFNSANVTAHHAIIPTEARADLSALDEAERNLYLLVARAYVAQFWPKKVTDTVTVVLDCSGYQFKVQASSLVSPGWSVLYKNDGSDQEGQKKQDDRVNVSAEHLNRLSRLSEGEPATCESTTIRKHKVAAPRHYTESTLLKDLRNVAKYVSDPKIAGLLRSKDRGKKGENGGIGTPATRDSFIETLIKRGFIEKRKGKLLSTLLGRAFFDVLPDIAKHPDMTALWHEQQCEIEAGQLTVEQFLTELVQTIETHVQEIKDQGLDAQALIDAWQTQPGNRADTRVPAETTEHACGACSKPLIRRLAKPSGKASSKSQARYWYGCSGYPDCKQTYPDMDGKPDLEGQLAKARQAASSASVGDPCPDCLKGALIKRDIKSGQNAGKPFIGCSGFPQCKFFRWYQ